MAMRQNTSSLEFWNVPEDDGLHRDSINVWNFLARLAVGKAACESVCLHLFPPIITMPFFCSDT